MTMTLRQQSSVAGLVRQGWVVLGKLRSGAVRLYRNDGGESAYVNVTKSGRAIERIEVSEA